MIFLISKRYFTVTCYSKVTLSYVTAMLPTVTWYIQWCYPLSHDTYNDVTHCHMLQQSYTLSHVTAMLHTVTCYSKVTHCHMLQQSYKLSHVTAKLYIVTTVCEFLFICCTHNQSTESLCTTFWCFYVFLKMCCSQTTMVLWVKNSDIFTMSYHPKDLLSSSFCTMLYQSIFLLFYSLHWAMGMIFLAEEPLVSILSHKNRWCHFSRTVDKCQPDVNARVTKLLPFRIINCTIFLAFLYDDTCHAVVISHVMLITGQKHDSGLLHDS